MNLFMAVIFALSTAYASATEPVNNEKPKTISQEVSNLLQQPGFEVERDLFATVTLMVNESNELVVLEVKTLSPSVQSYIKSRLNYKKVDLATPGSEIVLPVRIVPAA